MRINFGATYQEVQNLLKAPSKANASADSAEFEQSLGSLLPQANEVIDTIDFKRTQPSTPKSPMEEVKASYRFNDPGLEMPGMDPLPPSDVAPMVPENGGNSVKTPTLLEVRRVDLASLAGPVAPRTEALFTPGTPRVAEQQVAQTLQPKTESKEEQPKILAEVPPQLGKQELMARLSQASEKVGLDPALTKSLVRAESGFNVRAISTDGHASKGLFQLLDSTGKDLMSRADNQTRSYDPFDPDLNMELGTSYLRYLHDIFRTPTQLPNSHMTRSAANETSLEQLAVAAFNAGEGRVASAQHRSEQAGKDPAHYDNVAPFLPRSTREYVARVVGGKKLY
jgi:hypothetical protein